MTEMHTVDQIQTKRRAAEHNSRLIAHCIEKSNYIEAMQLAELVIQDCESLMLEGREAASGACEVK